VLLYQRAPLINPYLIVRTEYLCFLDFNILELGGDDGDFPASSSLLSIRKAKGCSCW